MYARAQFQAVTNHSGVIMWFSGPHIGTTSDIRLYELFPPPLLQGEKLLADKAYVSHIHTHSLLAPIKRTKQLDFTPLETDFNNIHKHYRASVEHSFGYLKRYTIVAALFRGKVCIDDTHLRNAIKILIHTDAIYITAFPHRIHRPLSNQLIHFVQTWAILTHRRKRLQRRLNRQRRQNNNVQRPPPVFDNEYEVEKITNVKREGEQIVYRVKWRGYPDEESTWETADNLQHSRLILEAFQRTNVYINFINLH